MGNFGNFNLGFFLKNIEFGKSFYRNHWYLKIG